MSARVRVGLNPFIQFRLSSSGYLQETLELRDTQWENTSLFLWLGGGGVYKYLTIDETL